MKLILALTEAADIPLDKLKNKMKKDPRVSFIFDKDPQLDQVKDPAEFIKTLRFYVFSNPSVRAHVERRGGARDISKAWWKKMAAIKPSEPLTAMQFSWLVQEVKGLFKDLSYVQQKKLSRRALENAIHLGTDGHGQLNAADIIELDSLDLKPSKPVTLYRGFHFKKADFEPSTWKKSLGLDFLRAIKSGTRSITFDYKEPEVWTSKKEDALHTALYGQRSHRRQEIGTKVEEGGALGFVAAIRAAPADVLVELSQLQPLTKGWPGQATPQYFHYILQPGKYTGRVVSKHTPEGEADPAGVKQQDTDLADLKDSLSLFGKLIKLPVTERVGNNDYVSLEHLLKRSIPLLKALIDPAVEAKVASLLKTAHSYYTKHLAKIDPQDVADQAGQEAATYKALVDIHQMFSVHIYHKDYADTASQQSWKRRGSVAIKDLKSGDEVLHQQINLSGLQTALTAYASQSRYTSFDEGNILASLARYADPSYYPPDKSHTRSQKLQQELLEKGVQGFFKAVEIPLPATRNEQAKEMLRLAARAIATAWGLNFLQRLQRTALSVAE